MYIWWKCWVAQIFEVQQKLNVYEMCLNKTQYMFVYLRFEIVCAPPGWTILISWYSHPAVQVSEGEQFQSKSVTLT